MKILLLTVLLFLYSEAVYCESNQWMSRGNNVANRSQCGVFNTCPTWFICDTEEKVCRCGKHHQCAVICDEVRLVSAVLHCNCVTYSEDTNSTYLGSCMFNCVEYNATTAYTKLPETPESLINNSVCTYFHRTGLLCGDCEDKHSPLVFSYNLSCVKCPDGHKNWWKLILFSFVPLTAFFFFVVVFNVNVTSSRLHGVVWFSQTISTPALVRVLFVELHNHHKRKFVVKIFMIFYSFWNLDILRSVLPDICLDVSLLQSLALEYLLALYPFMLILFSYFLVNVYDRFPCIVALWSPFRKFLVFFRKSWDVRTSIIDSFATFFLLSHVKIVSASADLLIPVQIYQLGSNYSSMGLYISPSVKYFGHEHLPYAVLAIVMLSIFVLLPTLILFLYPFQLFQKFLSLFPLNWHFLHVFVDSFQGCYKDGTQPGTFDCRWLSTSAILTRVTLMVIGGISQSKLTYTYIATFLIIWLIILINIQPFKVRAVRYPSTDTTFCVLLSLICIVILGLGVETKNSLSELILLLLSVSVPIIYMLGIVGVWFISRSKT